MGLEFCHAQVYAIDGIVPVADPSAYVHPSAVLIGDVIVAPRAGTPPLVTAPSCTAASFAAACSSA